MFTVNCLTIAAFSAEEKKKLNILQCDFSIKENGECLGSLFALASIYSTVYQGLEDQEKNKWNLQLLRLTTESRPIYLQTIFGFPGQYVIQYVNWPQFRIFYCMRFGSLIQTYLCSTVQECLTHSQTYRLCQGYFPLQLLLE